MFRKLTPAPATRMVRSSSCAPVATGATRSSSSAPVARIARSTATTPAPATPATSTGIPRNSSFTAGAVTETEFHDAHMKTKPEQFEDVQALLDQLSKINSFLIDTNNDWSKKIEMLSKLRGCLICNIPHCLKIVLDNSGLWKKCLNDGLKELRSSLTREYCITIAYFAVKYKARFMPLVEHMLPNMMNLVKNSAKIISSSAVILLQFISKYVEHTPLIPAIEKYMASKAPPIRTHAVKMIYSILLNWKSDALISQTPLISQIIKSGLTDANGECRTAAKEAYFLFRDKFANEAMKLHDSLDASRQRALKAF